MSPCIDHGQSGNKPGGYHQVRTGGRLHYVHRLAFEKAYGFAPTICRHLCHNPRCVNPEHLADGTHRDNARDRVAAGRSAKEQPRRRVLSREDEQTIARRYSGKQYLRDQPSMAQLAREYGVSTNAITGALKREGTRWYRK